MSSEAREFAKRTIKEHEVPRLDKTITKNGERIIQDFEKSLGS
jgi:trimethylamine:corrinoid methyltransferase-like protein